MSEEILINVTPAETRVAVIENGVLQDVHIERRSSRGLNGNIYVGKIARVLPGMDAAFVDIGMERNAFLHVSDILAVDGQEREDPARRSGAIRDFVHEGQRVVVQVTKDPLGSKGARVGTALSIPSRYLVLMPQSRHVGVSQKIEDPAERARIEALLRALVDELGDGDPPGLIVRTAAEGVDRESLRADLTLLLRLWAVIDERRQEAKGPALVYADLPLHLRVLRDLAGEQIDRVLIDGRENYADLHEFSAQLVPEICDRLECYTGGRPLFELHGIEGEIQKALSRKVDLKSGGHIVIDQTEAMTTIDVNTGSYVGRRNLEETGFKTNLEAATALARQLRLRNLGGIIIVDFIDMRQEEHRSQVLLALEKAMCGDPAKHQISGVSELGLVQLTRKRTRESLEHILCEDCPACQGRGSVKTAESICYEVFREIIREARAYENDTLVVLAAQTVVDRLLDEESANLADVAEFIGKSIKVRVEPTYNQQQFDIALL